MKKKISIPDLSVKVSTSAILAKQRKLSAQYTLEPIQDLETFYPINLAREINKVLEIEQITQPIIDNIKTKNQAILEIKNKYVTVREHCARILRDEPENENEKKSM